MASESVVSPFSGTATRLPFSLFDSRTTYSCIQDSTDDRVTSFRKRNWRWCWVECGDGFLLPEDAPYVEIIKKLQKSCYDEDYPFLFMGARGTQMIEESRKAGMQNVVNLHFDGVEVPQDGDLVVYYDESTKPVHQGIYRTGLKVESKWGGLFGKLVFRHDFFALPDYGGDTLKIYRLRESGAVAELPPPPKPEQLLYVQIGDEFQFVAKEENLAIRKAIEGMSNNAVLLTQKFPPIQCLDIAPSGFSQCTAYALSKSLPGYERMAGHDIDLLTAGPSQILASYYTATNDPRPGDIAVYSDTYGQRKHMGIYLGPDLIESKWGGGLVYRHPFFYVDPSYGDTIRFYRLKPDAHFIANSDVDDGCLIM